LTIFGSIRENFMSRHGFCDAPVTTLEHMTSTRIFIMLNMKNIKNMMNIINLSSARV